MGPENAYHTISIPTGTGVDITLGAKILAVNAIISGSISTSGGFDIHGTQSPCSSIVADLFLFIFPQLFSICTVGGVSANAQLGILYTNANSYGIQTPYSFNYQYNTPSFTNFNFEVTSASLSFEVSIQESIEFGISVVGAIDLLTVDYTIVEGTALQFSYGTITSSSLSVHINAPTTKASQTSITLDDASGPSLLVPGDSIIIRVEYEQLPIDEAIVLFYSLYNGINSYPIGKHQFNTSTTGCGVFEFDWIVPWDKTFENNDIWQAVVHSSALMDRKYFSFNEVNISVFTEIDSIFMQAPENGEVVTLDTGSLSVEYAVSWNHSLIRYFQPILGIYKTL